VSLLAPSLLDTVLNQSGAILGVLGFLFGFYQLRWADQAKTIRAQIEAQMRANLGSDL
jgi:hypothetical protein